MSKIKELIRTLGFLRVLLVVIVMWFVASAPFAGDEIVYSGWSMIPKLIVPVLVPIAFFVLPMDITMSRIMMSDKRGQARDRHKAVIMLDVVLLVLLLVTWLPYFVRLMRM